MLPAMIQNLEKAPSLREKKNLTLFETESRLEEVRLRLNHITWQMSRVAGE